MKFQTTEVSFSCGHRIWGNSNKCSHMHGHDATAVLHLSTPILNDESNFQWFDRFVRSHIDGKFIVDINDPFINGILDGGDILFEADRPYLQLSKHYGREKLSIIPIIEAQDTCLGYSINVAHWGDEPKRQFYEGFTLVNFNPTSYNCAAWIHDLAHAHLRSTQWAIEQTAWHQSRTYVSTYRPAARKQEA